MINFLINIMIVGYVLIFFEVLGNYTAKKVFKRNMLFNIPLGFIVYMSFFEIMMLVPMVRHLSYDIVLYFMLPLSFFISLFVIYQNGKATLIDFKEAFKESFVKIVYIVGGLFSSYVAFMAVSLGDGWLFSSMVMSSIQNGIIFSHNGVEVMGDIQSLHYTDGYYLYQSMLASLSPIDPFVFVMTYMKFIEAMMITLMMALLSNVVFTKYRKYIYLLQVIAVFLVINLFTIYVNTNEISIHLLQTIPIGTSMLNNLILIYLFIYYYIRNEETNNALFFVLITLAGFSFTASTMFLVVPFVFLLAVIDVIYYKKYNYIKYYLIPVFIVLFFMGVYLFLNNGLFLLFSGFTLFLILIFIFMFKLFQKIPNTYVDYLVKGVFIIYISFLFFGWIYLQSTYDIFTNFIALNHTETYRVYPHYYTDYTSSIFILLFSTLGLIRLYKFDKKIFVYVLFALFLFANILAYRTVGIFINKAVYHRLSNIVMINVVVISGFVYAIELLAQKVKIKISYLFIASFMLMFIGSQPVIRGDFNEYSSFEEYKFVDQNLYQLYNYEFTESNDVSLGVDATPKPNLDQNIDHLFRVRADLNWITMCEQDCYEVIGIDDQLPANSTLVTETNDYKVVYKGVNNE
jgi:hypothetical protein